MAWRQSTASKGDVSIRRGCCNLRFSAAMWLGASDIPFEEIVAGRTSGAVGGRILALDTQQHTREMSALIGLPCSLLPSSLFSAAASALLTMSLSSLAMRFCAMVAAVRRVL